MSEEVGGSNRVCDEKFPAGRSARGLIGSCPGNLTAILRPAMRWVHQRTAPLASISYRKCHCLESRPIFLRTPCNSIHHCLDSGFLTDGPTVGGEYVSADTRALGNADGPPASANKERWFVELIDPGRRVSLSAAARFKDADGDEADAMDLLDDLEGSAVTFSESGTLEIAPACEGGGPEDERKNGAKAQRRKAQRNAVARRAAAFRQGLVRAVLASHNAFLAAHPHLALAPPAAPKGSTEEKRRRTRSGAVSSDAIVPPAKPPGFPPLPGDRPPFDPMTEGHWHPAFQLASTTLAGAALPTFDFILTCLNILTIVLSMCISCTEIMCAEPLHPGLCCKRSSVQVNY